MFSVFQKYGVDESCVRLLAFIQSADGHLGTYNEIDIALDPFPYNGTTTSFEALGWAYHSLRVKVTVTVPVLECQC